MRLPLLYNLLPVVSLNTSGARAFKNHRQLERERDRGAEDPEVTWDSKVDSFDKRREMLYAQKDKDPDTPIREEEIADVSFNEFFQKFCVSRGKLHKVSTPVCMNVLPSLSADCANISDPRHELHARTAVVAHWRLMPTRERHELTRQGLDLRSAGVDE